MKRKPVFIRQQGSTDCGVACLLSVIRMHGGDASIETLRLQSGISLQGTSLLGLQQAAQKQNLNAEVFEAEEIEVFKEEASFPCILHVVMDGLREHFVVCYEIDAGRFLIIDPARGTTSWTESELLDRWKSRAVILLEPTLAFRQVKDQKARKLSWFKALIKEDLPLLSTAVILGILIALSGMGLAVFSQKLVDDILPNRLSTRLWTGIGLVTLILLVRGALSYLRTTFLLRQSREFNNRLMDDFYQKLLLLPKTFFDSRKTGDIIARLHDTRRIQSVISYFTGNVIIDVLILIISMVFVFFYSIETGLIAVSSIPVFGLMVWAFNKKILLAQKDTMVQYAVTESHFVDTISGIEAVKSADKEVFFYGLGKKVYKYFQDQVYNLGRLGSSYNFLNESFNTLFIISIMAYSAHRVFQDHLLPGEMMAILSIATGMLGAISRLATTNIQIQEAKVAFERMFEFANITPEDDREEWGQGEKISEINSLAIEQLSFRFPGKSRLLSGLSLKLKKGELTMILGEVGAGKSVLLQVLQKFQDYEEGQILINRSRELKDIPLRSWRNLIGVMPQEIKIFNGTLLDNIVMDEKTEDIEKAISFCRDYGFSYFFESMPQGYRTIVGEDGVKLSGGQKQLVILARALYRNPPVLLLDEPTSAMDKRTEAFVMNLLVSLKSEKIILLVSHRESVFKFADTIFNLKGGRILENAAVT